MKAIRSLMVAASLLLSLTVPAVAQTTVNSTTLAAAVSTTTVNQFQLASTSNISVGDYYAIVSGNVVREAGVVRAVASPYITVGRATVPIDPARASRLHASGSTVYTGSKVRFYQTESVGTCTSTAEAYLPHISLKSGFMYQCSPAGVWYRLDQTFTVNCRALLIADMVDQSCWNVDGNFVLIAIKEVHKTKEAGGTLTLIARRQQSTEAPASGDALNTALDMAAAATDETVRTATLTSTGSFLLLSAGERLGLDFTDDTAGELAGVTVTFVVAPR